MKIALRIAKFFANATHEVLDSISSCQNLSISALLPCSTTKRPCYMTHGFSKGSFVRRLRSSTGERKKKEKEKRRDESGVKKRRKKKWERTSKTGAFIRCTVNRPHYAVVITWRERNREKRGKKIQNEITQNRSRDFSRELLEKYVPPCGICTHFRRLFYRSATCYSDDAIGRRNGRGARY